MTGLRSDFTKLSTVKIHNKRQHSLNKQGKDGRNPGFVAGEQKHQNSVIYIGLHKDAQITGNRGYQNPCLLP